MMNRKDNRGFGLESNVHLPHITHQMASYNQTELAIMIKYIICG